jgi:hypothetical protein
MLAQSDFPIEVAIAAFARWGLEATYLVPTATGIDKSIMDAHKGFRAFLKFRGIHDFDLQGLGNEEHGKKLEITLVGIDSLESKEISLYRPRTKNGDPRVWTNIRGYAKPNNLLALLADPTGKLFLINCSEPKIFGQLDEEDSPLGILLASLAKNPNSENLLALLRNIAARGWVNSSRQGDTAVGHTLESLLGINANSSKRPDYLDEIELKSGRRKVSGKPKNRSTLLSKVPNWKNSAMRAAEILKTFGEVSSTTGRQELYVTVSQSPNRQGLYLLYSETAELIENRALRATGDLEVAQWSVIDLQEDLRSKHRETFWVQAESRIGPDGNEQFRYFRAVRTRQPLVSNIGPLINLGVITLDYTLSQKVNGSVRDHGYLFRIWPKDLSLLFPEVETFELT